MSILKYTIIVYPLPLLNLRVYLTGSTQNGNILHSSLFKSTPSPSAYRYFTMATIKQVAVVLLLSLCGYVKAATTRIPGHDTPDPSLPTDPAVLARYILAKSDWLSLGTLSSLKGYSGYPFVGLESTSDGTKTKSTGIPYLFMSDLEISSQDVAKDDRVSVMVSLAQTDYCKNKKVDAQNPNCVKVYIIGKFVKVDKTSTEYQFAKTALFEKHPEMKFWPESHGFYIAKVVPLHIKLLGAFGGINDISKEEYLNADVSSFL